jgi:glycosyltransferase involved in cell wall biosynthesis
LHLVYAIDHLGGGGAQRQVVELGLHLGARKDLRVTILTYHDVDFFGERLRRAGIEVVRVAKRGALDATLPWRMARWMRSARPDVVHAYMLAPSLWSLLASRCLPRSLRPAVIAADRSGRIGEGRAQSALERFVYGRADAVTVNAEPLVAGMQALGVPQERIHYLPNGIDLEAWDRERARPCPLEFEPGRFHVGLVGRLEPQKNHGLLLEALSRIGPERLADWRVWFVGAASGGEAFAGRLRAEVAGRGLARIVQFVPLQRDVAAVLQGLNVLALPSSYEGFPNVLLEAMACGVPSVAAAVGDVPNLIEDGVTGLLVDALDADRLAAALLDLRGRSEAERRRMGERARAAVEARYRMPVVAARHLELYRRLCERAPAARQVAHG